MGSYRFAPFVSPLASWYWSSFTYMSSTSLSPDKAWNYTIRITELYTTTPIIFWTGMCDIHEWVNFQRVHRFCVSHCANYTFWETSHPLYRNTYSTYSMQISRSSLKYVVPTESAQSSNSNRVSPNLSANSRIFLSTSTVSPVLMKRTAIASLCVTRGGIDVDVSTCGPLVSYREHCNLTVGAKLPTLRGRDWFTNDLSTCIRNPNR